MNFLKKNWLWLGLILLFWVKGIIYLDPDFGWHLRMGRLILAKGIPPTDPFSYTMAGFRFVDHEWLTNVLIALAFPFLGRTGLSLVWSLAAVAALGISLRRAKNYGRLKWAAVLLAAGTLIGFFGIRPQVISWLFVAILLWLLANWEKFKFIPFLTPGLFLLWANLHGSFGLGLLILPLFLGIKAWRTERLVLRDWLTVVASVGVTLINPYGVRLWAEVWVNFADNSLRWQIQEWLPGVTALIFCLLFLASLSGFFLWRYRRRFPAETQAVNIVFMGLAVSAIRHLPLLALVTAPVLVEGVVLLEKEVRLIKSGPDRLKKAGKVFLVLTAVFFILDASQAFRGSYLLAESVFYPRKAVDFLAADLPPGEIFSDYGWGGYLIWKLPQKRVFIDGRMSHWPGILKKFSQIVSGKEAYQPVFAQYNIDTVLWPVAKDSREVKLLTRLREDGWQEIYRDKIALILRRPK